MSTQSSTKLLKSNHIFLDSESPSISGYVLIENNRILDVQQFSTITPEHEQKLLSKYQLYDFTESYIMPGIIDLNVHTHCTFDSEWRDVENLTKQAVQGGVTTIFDNPIMNQYDETLEESEILKKRKEALQDHIYTNCGLLAYLGPHNYKKIDALWEDRDVMGFKAYLSQTFQMNLPFFKNKESLGKLFALLKKLELKNLFLSIHPEKATLRDLYLSSPLRDLPIAKRLDLKEDITNAAKFGGGIDGGMDSGEDSNKSDKSEEDDAEPTFKDQLRQMIPTSAFLRKRAQDNDKLREEQNIHKQEISEYFFNEEEKEIIKGLQTSDSEIEYQNETTSSSSGDEENCKENQKEVQKSPEIQTKPRLIMQGLKTKTIMTNLKLPGANEERKETFARNPLINSIRGALGSLKTSTEPEFPVEKEGERKERKISGLLQRRKVANSAIISNKATEELKTFQISIRKGGQSNQAKVANNANKLYENFLYNHSLSWETTGIKLILKIFKEFSNGNILLSNLSALSLAFLVRERTKKGSDMQIFCETSTPFLYFYNNMIKKGQCKFKSSPPIRDQETRNLLLEGVKIKNLFQAVSSFHMSVPRKLKKIDGGDFKRCFNGLSTIGMNLQVLWSKLYSKEKGAYRKFGDKTTYEDNINEIMKLLVKLLCEGPAKMAFLKTKGRLAKGFDADIVVWNPFETKEVLDKDISLKEKKGFLFRKQKVYGVVKATFLGGEEVYKEKERKFVKKGVILQREKETM